MRSADWIEDLFTALDAGDVDTFCDYMTEDVDFVYASEGTISGLADVHAFVADFVDGIESSDHKLEEIITTPGRAVVRGEVSYVRRDGSELTVPFANIFEMEGGAIAVYQVYVDQEL